MSKKIVIILSTIAVMIISIITIINGIQVKKEKTPTSNPKIKIESFRIEGRESLKLDNTLLIGNNIKELENNFYDIKIINTEYGIDIFLNKLWYKEYNKDFIQEDYLAKICRQIDNNFGVENATEEFEYVLYKYIKENYTKIRKGAYVEKINTENFTIEFELKDNIPKLIIRGE